MATTSNRTTDTPTEEFDLKRWLGDAAQLLLLLLLILLIAFPLYYMVISSLKTQQAIFTTPPQLFGFEPTLQHYQALFEAGDVPRATLNSFIVAGATTVLAVILGTPAAYVLARYDFRGRKDIWFWFITNRFVSPIVVVLPFFLIGRNIGGIDTHWYLIAIYQLFSVPLVVWLCMDQFRSIPHEIDDAAKVDGCNLWQTFFYINLPVALPGVVVSAILTFIFAWNELIFGLLLTNSPSGARTAPAQATTFMGGMGIEWGEIMATGTLIILPIVIFAALVSQHIVQGLTMGAVE